jgi:DnaJ-domain-containing protein 1
MPQSSEAIAHWLEQKRCSDRASAAVIAVLAFGSGAAVFLMMALLAFAFLSLLCAPFFNSSAWPVLMALGLTAGFFLRSMHVRQDGHQLGLDPMGLWILKDISSIGPRLLNEGLRQVQCWGQLGEMNVAACARALTYLAGQNAAVTWQDLVRHCPQLPWSRLKEQLSLVDGVLFLGEEAARVTLMDPFRLRLHRMLERDHRAQAGPEPARPRPEPTPQGIPADEPEKLSAYELLGLSPSASVAEIKAAYRRRVKQCHPDLFASMDQQSKALAERWTKALNAAYATLNPRHGNARRGSTEQR